MKIASDNSPCNVTAFNEVKGITETVLSEMNDAEDQQLTNLRYLVFIPMLYFCLHQLVIY